MMFHIGIDVSKLKLDICLLSEGVKGKQKHKSLANNCQSVTQLCQWLQKQAVTHEQVRIIMEATGIYHESLFYTLHQAGFHVSLANPQRVKNFAKGMGVLTKNDQVDVLDDIFCLFYSMARSRLPIF